MIKKNLPRTRVILRQRACHALFQLDNEDQGWLEILVKVDKSQQLVWVGSGGLIRPTQDLDGRSNSFISKSRCNGLVQ